MNIFLINGDTIAIDVNDNSNEKRDFTIYIQRYTGENNRISFLISLEDYTVVKDPDFNLEEIQAYRREAKILASDSIFDILRDFVINIERFCIKSGDLAFSGCNFLIDSDLLEAPHQTGLGVTYDDYSITLRNYHGLNINSSLKSPIFDELFEGLKQKVEKTNEQGELLGTDEKVREFLETRCNRANIPFHSTNREKQRFLMEQYSQKKL